MGPKLVFFALALAACNSSSAAVDGTQADAAAPVEASTDSDAGTSDVTVHAVVDLPRTSATQGLSGTAFDPATRTLYTIEDKTPVIVPIVGNEDFTAFTVGMPIALTGRPGTAWDGEALVRASGGFIAVTVETAPTVERFDKSGAFTGALAIPARFADQAPGNKGLESLTISPSGRYLFTANEEALLTDGEITTKARGTTVRILRHELATGADTEFAYRTETLGAGNASGDMGVSELAAIDDDHLLVLERGFQTGYGNTVRIFRVDLAGGSRVDALPSLVATTPVLAKTLLVDIAALPSGGVTHPGVEPNPLLDNYEALAIGPTLADGRRLLFVTSDDNASASQVARVLVLAVRGL